MTSRSRYYVYATNRILFHIILFSSFVAAVYLLPMIEELIMPYISNVTLLWIAKMALAYVGAIYLLPELAFFLVKLSKGDD